MTYAVDLGREFVVNGLRRSVTYGRMMIEWSLLRDYRVIAMRTMASPTPSDSSQGRSSLYREVLFYISTIGVYFRESFRQDISISLRHHERQVITEFFQ